MNDNSNAELREALRDCVECLKRLPNVEGAYRVTCIWQAEQVLKDMKTLPTVKTRNGRTTEKQLASENTQLRHALKGLLNAFVVPSAYPRFMPDEPNYRFIELATAESLAVEALKQ